jgi:hypothetical protein
VANTKRVIERALAPLVGAPWVVSRRAADMQVFQFGRVMTVHDRRGAEREVGEYALHVQCAWRILGPKGIFVGSRDVYTPASSYKGNLDQHEWDRPGANRRDELVAELLQEHAISPLVVERIRGSGVGDLRIVFSDGYRLEVFPDSSNDAEQWRFFPTSGGREHLVATGARVEYG